MLRYDNKVLKFNYCQGGKVKRFEHAFTDHKVGMQCFNYLHQLSFPYINGIQAVLTDQQDLNYIAELIAKDKLAGRQFSLALDYGIDVEQYPDDKAEAAMGMGDLACYPRGYVGSNHQPRLVAREIVLRESANKQSILTREIYQQ